MQNKISKYFFRTCIKIDVSAAKLGDRIPIMVAHACSMYRLDQKFSIRLLILFTHILSL